MAWTKEDEQRYLTTPYFGCAQCQETAGHRSDDLHVFEGLPWCRDCWDDSEFWQLHSWDDLEPFVPEHDQRISELERGLKMAESALRAMEEQHDPVPVIEFREWLADYQNSVEGK